MAIKPLDGKGGGGWQNHAGVTMEQMDDQKHLQWQSNLWTWGGGGGIMLEMTKNIYNGNQTSGLGEGEGESC